MSKPAAKQGDTVTGTDTHVLMVPTPTGPVPTPTPMPFCGVLADGLSPDVLIEALAAATMGSVAINTPPHVPAAGPFQKAPSNQGTIEAGSASVLINDKPAARGGDPAVTCNDPCDAPQGTVIASSTVLIGD